MTSQTPARPRRLSLRRNSIQPFDELRVRGLGLGGADVDAEHLALAVAVDADRDDRRHRDDPAVLAHLHVGGVEPKIRPLTVDRPLQEGLHALVDLGAAGSPGFEMPLMPSDFTRSSTERVETPWM